MDDIRQELLEAIQELKAALILKYNKHHDKGTGQFTSGPGGGGGKAAGNSKESAGVTSKKPTKAFKDATNPLKKAKFGDEVVFQDANGDVKVGILANPGNKDGYGIRLADGSIAHVPKENLRMRKGAKRVKEFR